MDRGVSTLGAEEMSVGAAKKPGRNDSCPCGSGKKYKKCCLLREAQKTAPAPSTWLTKPRSKADVAAFVTEEIGGGESFGLTAYTIAKIVEDPRSAGDNSELRKRIEKGSLTMWGIKRVRAMSTEAIEAQLAAYGVRHSRARFLRLAESRTSAWSISNVWMSEDQLSSSGKEEDFLGLAACELWRRYLSERPSIEMLDDSMQEGYDLLEKKKCPEACDLWWKIWCTLRPRMTPDMTTMDAASAVFHGSQALFNWCQDLEMELGNAASGDERYANIGRQYCSEWLAQFTEETALTQSNFGQALARFMLELREPEEAEKVLRELLEEWPDNAWSYIAVADAYSHGEHLTLDLQKASGLLEMALALPHLRPDERAEARKRLAKINRRTLQ
ncbi:MAG: SEC-C domain-containing protein [Deltaproteobacteria bacterium]|nr:SEC-C domain-containing protein [Deltaproteobacteria bacterium]